MIYRLLILTSILLFANSAQGGEWYAMSRHGACFDLAKLNNRDDLVKGTSTPEEMEDRFKKAGIQYTIKPLMENQDTILQLEVPSKNWAMILVVKSHCKEFVKR